MLDLNDRTIKTLTTRNRGKDSSDDKWFAPKWHPIFTEAVDDLCYLLTRGYAASSALEVVGNRYTLNKRQRSAVSRISCSDQGIRTRNKSRCNVSELEGRVVEIDGFNLLILLESALSGAFVFKGRDGVFRDISSVHGSYKRVAKTEEAMLLTGNSLKAMNVKSVKWYLDQPVSNSGRLKTQLLEISNANGLNWDAELVFDPDKVLAESKHIVISSDGWVLEQAGKWFNMGAYLIENQVKEAHVIAV